MNRATIENLPAQIPHVAWTGGTVPAPLRDTHRRERSLVRCQFRQDARAHIDYWGGMPHAVARILWVRARHDAFASIRAALRAGLTRGAA